MSLKSLFLYFVLGCIIGIVGLALFNSFLLKDKGQNFLEQLPFVQKKVRTEPSESLETKEREASDRPQSIPAINLEISVDQISECEGYFAPVKKPPEGVFGLVKEKRLDEDFLLIDGEKVGISSLDETQVFVITDMERYEQGVLDSMKKLEQNFGVDELVENLNVGSHVWVADLEIGKIIRVYCSAESFVE